MSSENILSSFHHPEGVLTDVPLNRRGFSDMNSPPAFSLFSRAGSQEICS